MSRGPVVVETSGELRRHAGGIFVPTMGALHAGHAALVRRAAELAAERGGAPVVVSIFVNPTQFAPNEDFTRYPRTLEADLELAGEAGATVAFVPRVEEMYPPGETVMTPPLPPTATEPKLEDAFRPTHFAGVCQVVARLFDLVRPRAAVFGEKDYQQLRVITQMVERAGGRWGELRIVPHETVREQDGLAMSSRNRYLKVEERERALALSRALRGVSLGMGVAEAESMMRAMLESAGLKVDYAVVRDEATLGPVEEMRPGARALIAARLGEVRLIDNAAVG